MEMFLNTDADEMISSFLVLLKIKPLLILHIGSL
jgi:hypothetical protein